METKNLQTAQEQMLLFPGASTSSLEERRANHFLLPENAKDLKEQADLPTTLSACLKRCAPGGSSGRTCRARSQAGLVDDTTSNFWSTSMQNAGMLADGAFSTLNMCEWTDSLVPFLSEDGVCSLSDILVRGNIPPKYYLSRKACFGILRRAESRGKALPEVLKNALARQAGIPKYMTDGDIAEYANQMFTAKQKRRCPGGSSGDDRPIDGHEGGCECGRPWDRSGVNPTLNQCSAGSGIIGASNQELFSQNANGLVICGQPSPHGEIAEDISPTIKNRDYKDPAFVCMEKNAIAIAENIIGRQPQNGGNGDGYSEELAYTQNASGVMGVMDAVSFEPGVARRDGGESRFAEDICSTLRARMGDNQTAVACVEEAYFDIGDRRRVTEDNGISPTMTSKMGTGGNNVPVIIGGSK